MKATYTRILTILTIMFCAATIVSCGENDILEPSISNNGDKDELKLDTVTSRFKYEYTYNDGVVELNDEHFAWFDPSNVARVNQEVIYLKENTPEKFIPKKGDVFVVNNGVNDVFPFGYMGKVTWVDTEARPIAVHVDNATLEEVYKELDLDVRLNAEQMKNLPYGYAVMDDGTVVEETVSEETTNNKISSSVSKNGSYYDEDDKKEGPDIKVEVSPDGTWKLVLEKTFDKKFKNFSIKPNGYIGVRPLYNERRVLVQNSKTKENKRNDGWLFCYDGNIEFAYGNEKSNDDSKLVIKGKTFSFNYPIPSTPICISVKYRPTLKLTGSVSAALGLKGSNIIKFGSTSNQDEVLQSDGETNLDWGNKFKFYFDYLKFSGGLSFDFNFATYIYGVPAVAACKTTFALGGKANFSDPNLLKENPKIGFNITSKLGAYYMKNLFNYEEEGFGIWKDFELFNYDIFPIFQQYEYAYGNVNKKNNIGSFIYDSDPYYLMYPLKNLFKMKQKVAFVTEGWLKEQQENYIVKIAEPVEMGSKGSLTRYATTVSGLNANNKYYAVPIVDVTNFMRYYGKPVPISDVPSLRLCAIGPDYGQTLLDGERMYMTIAYDEKGLPKRIFNTMNESDTYISHDPLTIRQKEYTINSDGIREYDTPTYITDVVRDKESGVVKSYRWHDNEDSGTLKFYYDDQYHVTGFSNSGTDGWATVKFTWDKRGCLTNIHSTEDDGSSVDFTYSYRNDDKYANTQGVWTLATGSFMDMLTFGRLLGRAPAHLPTSMVLTSVDKNPGQETETSVTRCNISYKFAGHGENSYIESEKWLIREDGESLSLDMPYAYRNITVDEDELEHDKKVGMNRSISIRQKSADIKFKKILQRMRLLKH